MTAPWMTQRAGSLPAPVATASPTSIGPCWIASRSISSPPARLIAPATPPPIQSRLFAAFAIASTSSAVMSPSRTEIELSNQRLEPDGQARWKIADPLQRQQHAGDVRLAREGVVADRQQLAVTAQQHLLMGDETR